jgi:hypothetical protein
VEGAADPSEVTLLLGKPRTWLVGSVFPPSEHDCLRVLPCPPRTSVGKTTTATTKLEILTPMAAVAVAHKCFSSLPRLSTATLSYCIIIHAGVHMLIGLHLPQRINRWTYATKIDCVSFEDTLAVFSMSYVLEITWTAKCYVGPRPFQPRANPSSLDFRNEEMASDWI